MGRHQIHTGPCTRAHRRPTRARALAAGLTLAALALATAAQAQLGDPGTQTLDTDVTPVAKESERWSWVAGAAYSSDGPKPSDVPEDSVTPFEADLFTVSFHEPGGGKPAENGFAGGAVCREPVPEGASPEEAREHTGTCERVPVIYRYSVNDIGEASWEEAYRGTSPGYVGAIDWISEGRALAVGGTGEFPRREHQQSESDPAGDDAAEDGRAWLYENGSWRELTDLPAGMRGMSALDVSPRPSDCGPGVTSVCAVAGGFRQLWMFEDGAFTRGVSDQSPDSALDRAYLFQFRVRDIGFASGFSGSSLALQDPTRTRIRAVAATSGCCAADEFQNGPRLLVFDSERWYLRQPEGDPSTTSNAFDQDQDAWDAIFNEPENPAKEQIDPLNEQLDRATSPYGGAKPISSDSFYALRIGTTDVGDEHPSAAFSAIATPGGPPAAGEELSDPASQFISGQVRVDRGRRSFVIQQAPISIDHVISNPITGKFSTGGTVPPANFTNSNTDKLLSSLRLHDFDATPQPMKDNSFLPSQVQLLAPLGTSANIEAVGVLRATGQGVAYGPQEHFPSRDPDNLHGCNTGESGLPENCDPDAERFIAAYASRNLHALPSYALNSVQVTNRITGTGWAVGDHGAILSLAGSTSSQAQSQEPEPPRLGQRKAQELPGSDAYDSHRKPLTAEPGTVPPYGASGTQQLREPRFVSAGTPGGGDANLIVMSRDGSEGWAFTAGPPVYRYSGAAWGLCDPQSDPACAALAPLVKANKGIGAAGRVPLENDENPPNDDELEIVALAGNGQAFRYRDGRWALDEGATKAGVSGRDVVFTAPDDGWVGGKPGTSADIYHFNREGWVKCSTDPEACDDPAHRLSAPLEELTAGSGDTGNDAQNDRGLRLAVAGERVYAFGTRRVGTGTASGAADDSYPMIVYRDRGGTWTGGMDESDDGVYNPTDGGWDPGYYAAGEDGKRIVDPPPVRRDLVDPTIDAVASMVDNAAKGEDRTNDQGRIFTVSVTVAEEGVEGWALGFFGGYNGSDAEAVLMQLKGGRWSQWSNGDAADDYLRELNHKTALDPRNHLTLAHTTGAHSSFIFQPGAPALAFNEEANAGEGRWEALPTPWLGTQRFSLRTAEGTVTMAGSDGSGGLWAGVAGSGADGARFSFQHHTDRPPKPVFEDVPLPARNDRVTAMAPGGDGSLWLGDANGLLYRHDRLTGWSRGARAPGWDPPRSTASTPINAIALGPDGRGIAVGNGGRIAEVGPDAVRLDEAAGTLCDFAQPTPPCGTGRDLNDAAIAPGGSALAVGDAATLLWRPAGGEFRRLEPPTLPRGTDFTGVELPAPNTAYVLANDRKLLRGTLDAGSWNWRFDLGTLTAFDPLTGTKPINDLTIDAEGQGYAVGPNGLLLERHSGDSGSWRRLESGYSLDLQAVATPTVGGEGLLIGADGGTVLTRVGERPAVSRPADPYDPVGHADVTGVALVPGLDADQIEAWVALRGREAFTNRRSPTPQALLHHTSHPDEPLLDPTRRAAPLPDAPPPRPAELSFAAFGKQDCLAQRRTPGNFGATFNATAPCPPPNGSNLTHEEIPERITDELLQRSERPGGPEFALFTGDASDAPGGGWLAQGFAIESPDARTPIDRNLKHRRWVELVADRLADAGLPILGALGGQDLALHGEVGMHSATDVFFGGNLSAKQPAEGAGVRGGLNLPWRNTMAAMPAPWEREANEGPLGFERVEGGGLSQEIPEAETPEARRGAKARGFFADARLEPVSTAGAPTHYATDVIRDGEKVARIVVADTSMGSLAASNAQQYPIEVGGQERWLEEVLCFDGSATDTNDDIRDCTREPDQQAIVLTNTPTYSYGPIAPDETLTDAAAFEAILLRNQVNVVVSGRLGWNGLYWATAPGVHEPCPGGAYQMEPPKPGVRSCGQGNAELDEAVSDAQGEAQELADGTPIGTLPFVVSSTAGGRFNERAERSGAATPENGFWRGYSIVRLATDGDPQKTIVEQRPILDWVGLEAGERELEPRGTVRLEGYAREAFGLDTPARYIEIASPAITHRYDLLLADPEEPWVPCEAGDAGCEGLYSKLSEGPRSFDSAAASGTGSAQDDNAGASASAIVGEGENACDPYLCLPERVGTVDSQSGEVRAGNGKYPDTFAVGMLSVGDHVATYPLVFKRSPSFIVSPAVGFPAVPSVPAGTGTAPQPPQPPNPPTPNVPQPSTPSVPAPPSVPPIAASDPPEPQPPAPPAPPPPSEAPAPISLTLAPPSIAIATPTAVIQPPTPPVNPAPPGGARREARQRQAAAQKSGADSDQEAGEQQFDGANSPNAPPGAAFTRHDHSFTARRQGRSEPSFTTLSRADGEDSTGPALLYTGSITLLALAAALGFSHGRPTPKRRSPEAPAPAWARSRSR